MAKVASMVMSDDICVRSKWVRDGKSETQQQLHAAIKTDAMQLLKDVINHTRNVLRPPPPPDSAHALDMRKVYRLAERFVFEEDPYVAVKSMMESGALEKGQAEKFARAPHDVMWLEWRSEARYVGYLVECGDDRVDGMWTVVQYQHCDDVRSGLPAVSPVLGMLMDPLPWPKGTDHTQGRAIFAYGNSLEYRSERMREAAWDVMCALFLLSVPRACELRDHVPSAKLQKRRAERRELPLFEYKKVKLQVGVGSPRYSPGAGGGPGGPGAGMDGTHKRLHPVMGHFRTYTKRREEPLLSWVPEHWRGDAALGVVLHEREVRR